MIVGRASGRTLLFAMPGSPWLPQQSFLFKKEKREKNKSFSHEDFYTS
jgi:hypothetical protein